MRRHPEAVSVPGVLVARPNGELLYVNTQNLRDAIEVEMKHPGPATRVVIIDLDANDEIDITSADMLNKLADGLERQDSRLVLTHVHQPVLQVAREAGLLKKTGDDHIFPDIATAIEWAANESTRLSLACTVLHCEHGRCGSPRVARDYTDMLTTHAAVPRKMMQPTTSSALHVPAPRRLMLMPAKNRATANIATART